MTAEEFLIDVCPNHTDTSKWNKSELLHILELHEKQLRSEQLRKESLSNSTPNEEQVLKTLFDCVFIRGINLEDYKRNFTNEQSGLYDALVELFKNKNALPSVVSKELYEAVKVELQIIKNLIASKRVINLDEAIAYYESLLKKYEHMC